MDHTKLKILRRKSSGELAKLWKSRDSYPPDTVAALRAVLEEKGLVTVAENPETGTSDVTFKQPIAFEMHPEKMSMSEEDPEENIGNSDRIRERKRTSGYFEMEGLLFMVANAIKWGAVGLGFVVVGSVMQGIPITMDNLSFFGLAGVIGGAIYGRWVSLVE